MPNLTDLAEVAHWYGSDLQVSSTGDLAVVGGGQAGQIVKSNQRVLRRLCTNAGDYIFEPPYGAGLPSKVGTNLEVAAIQALVAGQMKLEGSVASSPPPAVTVTPFRSGAQIDASYTVAPEAVPAVLSFTAEP